MIRRILLDVLFLVVSVTTLCQGARIVISAIPSTISEGVTPTFSIRCALEDVDAESHISRVSSILIRKAEASIQREVARISTGQAAVAGPGATGALVSGDLSNKLGHLEATWSPPGQEQSGSYNCEIVAEDADGIKVKFRSNIQVGSAGASGSSLAKQVARNKEDIQALKNAISDLQTNGIQRDQKAIAECQSQIDDLRNVVNGLRTDISGLSLPHNEEGVVVCKNSDAWGEKMKPRETVVEVRFSTPYTKNPLVDISVVKLDVVNTHNNRYEVQIRDLTPTGFKVVCGTWWDTLIHQVNVRWTSSLG